jgi:hypothetical protein
MFYRLLEAERQIVELRARIAALEQRVTENTQSSGLHPLLRMPGAVPTLPEEAFRHIPELKRW